jgi:hypothetical protein
MDCGGVYTVLTVVVLGPVVVVAVPARVLVLVLLPIVGLGRWMASEAVVPWLRTPATSAKAITPGSACLGFSQLIT